MFYYLREFPARVTAEYIFWRRKRLYLRGLYGAFRFRVASETGAIQKVFLSAFSQYDYVCVMRDILINIYKIDSIIFFILLQFVCAAFAETIAKTCL